MDLLTDTVLKPRKLRGHSFGPLWPTIMPACAFFHIHGWWVTLVHLISAHYPQFTRRPKLQQPSASLTPTTGFPPVPTMPQPKSPLYQHTPQEYASLRPHRSRDAHRPPPKLQWCSQWGRKQLCRPVARCLSLHRNWPTDHCPMHRCFTSYGMHHCTVDGCTEMLS